MLNYRTLLGGLGVLNVDVSKDIQWANQGQDSLTFMVVPWMASSTGDGSMRVCCWQLLDFPHGPVYVCVFGSLSVSEITCKG